MAVLEDCALDKIHNLQVKYMFLHWTHSLLFQHKRTVRICTEMSNYIAEGVVEKTPQVVYFL